MFHLNAVVSAQILQQPHDQGRPPCLVIGSATAAIITMEVFEKPYEVAPMRVIGKDAHIALPGAASRLVGKEDFSNPARQLAGLPHPRFPMRKTHR